MLEKYALLRLKGDHGGEFGWHDTEGSWPPPERLAIARGNTSGAEVVFDPDNRAPDAPPLELVERIASIYYFKRISFSQLTSDEADHPNLIRGAAYEEEV